LKQELEETAIKAGFMIKYLAKSKKKKKYQLINRIMIEELEAWFFGDIPALTKAYPKVSKNLNQNAKYRHQKIRSQTSPFKGMKKIYSIFQS